MIEGVSLAKAAERCGVHPTTAYRWRHRFLSAPALDKPRTLQGIVEADEIFVLESFKGRRSGLTREPRERGGKARHPGGFFENIPVLVARDRSGATTDAVLPDGRVHNPSARRRRVSCKPARVRWRSAFTRLRPTRQNSRARGSRTGKAASRRPRDPHQQRQCLSFPSQGMAAALPWRGNQEPAQLHGLAVRPRSPRGTNKSTDMAARSAWPRRLPIANAIRALLFGNKKVCHRRSRAVRAPAHFAVPDRLTRATTQREAVPCAFLRLVLDDQRRWPGRRGWSAA